ncbi:MAG TPA: hypothetical protein VD963_08335 [Phycisphaerales bacterium]|nr:hypothetical protein [Phycisphaerales bacterium]
MPRPRPEPGGAERGEPGAFAPAPPPRWRGPALFIAGVLLLAAAVWAVTTRGPDLARAWSAARAAPVWLVVLVLALPLANWALTTALFWRLTRRFAPVGAGEMTALIGSAWLLNYLPLRPGMLGRMAYHKHVHGIRYRDSLDVMLWSVGATAAGAALVLGAILACSGRAPWVSVGAGVIAGILLGIALVWRGAAHAWIALTLRTLDVLVWCVRYWAAFALLGRGISPLEAGILAAASQGAMVVPVQLGVREWLVGSAYAALPALGALAGPDLPGPARAPAPPPPAAESAGAALAAMTPGLLAELVNRAAELLIALPAGLVSTAWLARARARVPTRAPASRQSGR